MRDLHLPLLLLLLLLGCNRTLPDSSPTEGGSVKRDKPDLFKISDAIFDRYRKLGYEKLSYPEKVFFCVWELEAEVNNGGFDQYYFNTSGKSALDTPESLRAIGANHTANLVKQANDLFGPGGPSLEREKRQNQLDALSEAATKKMGEFDEEFYKYLDDLEQLLTEYVSKNSEAFRLDRR